MWEYTYTKEEEEFIDREGYKSMYAFDLMTKYLSEKNVIKPISGTNIYGANECSNGIRTLSPSVREQFDNLAYRIADGELDINDVEKNIENYIKESE